MLTLAEVLLNHHILTLAREAVAAKAKSANVRVEPPAPHSVQVRNNAAVVTIPPVAALNLATKAQLAQPAPTTEQSGTGVYFNDREVPHELHPSQVVYPVRYTSVVRSLPAGKPMPQPPMLVTHEHDTNEDSKSVSDEMISNRHLVEADKASKRKLDTSEADNTRQSKRHRAYQKPLALSNEQKTFLEAALQLSESTPLPPPPPPPPASKPVKKLSALVTPVLSPCLQALPPPPLLLSPGHLDLKSSAKSHLI